MVFTDVHQVHQAKYTWAPKYDSDRYTHIHLYPWARIDPASLSWPPDHVLIQMIQIYRYQEQKNKTCSMHPFVWEQGLGTMWCPAVLPTRIWYKSYTYSEPTYSDSVGMMP